MYKSAQFSIPILAKREVYIYARGCAVSREEKVIDEESYYNNAFKITRRLNSGQY